MSCGRFGSADRCGACLCSGATLKTRKRNISVPLDPGSFADAVVTIINDAKTPDAPIEKNLGGHLTHAAPVAARSNSNRGCSANRAGTCCQACDLHHTGAGVKGLESVDLDFSRYGDTLFEVLFAGGRMAGGGNVVEEGKKLDTNVSLEVPVRELVP